MQFEWDPVKAESNEAKHGIDFAQAAQIFADFHLVQPDSRKDYGEHRWVALGCYDGVTINVVFTKRKEATRIISAWRASREERKYYQNQKAQHAGAL